MAEKSWLREVYDEARNGMKDWPEWMKSRQGFIEDVGQTTEPHPASAVSSENQEGSVQTSIK